ncbi:hypothetical protein B0H15DRAFT_802202 [Mycena belliarum]|uniref:Uncharacterized protein n=1 Tax=Mycena belliarum TaxID=1033014 RepID=A0AAD6U2L0_9AGAR|nr:hypothetical protein B0H15DRAFT_802202 [Mycena belliae]
MFAAAENLSLREVKAYRDFYHSMVICQVFPGQLGDPTHNPFFPIDNATSWMTSHGYQLYLGHDDRAVLAFPWAPEDASTKQLKAYRQNLEILGDEYLDHPFFSLENSKAWINLVAFQAYMDMHFGEFHSIPNSRVPSRASSFVGSRASSRASLVPSSRASSPVSACPDSRPSSAMSFSEVIEIYDSDDPNDLNPWGEPPPPVLIPKVEEPPLPDKSTTLIPAAPARGPSQQRKGKGKEKAKQISITRQLKVDEILDIPKVPDTWDVPRQPTAYRLDASEYLHLLQTEEKQTMAFDTFIRSQDQDSWTGSTGHSKGDVNVSGFTSDPNEKLWSRRCQFRCNGVETCEFFDPALLADCERYEPDYEAMSGLFNHEMDATEDEAAFPAGVISRFYSRIMSSKCKIECDGTPILVRRSKGADKYGKKHFVGCSKWSPAEQFDHLYWPIDGNIDEDTLHHIIDGCIKPGRIVPRPCNTEMLIFIPVDSEYSHQAIVILRQPHNHPVHPKSKPSADDLAKLGTAVRAAGVTGLTVQKLIDAHRISSAPSTSTIYGGRLTERSPALTDKRRLRDLIGREKKKEHPHGMGWEGVLYQLNTREVKLTRSERYIHTAMSKNGFRLVVTMHPQIVRFIHRILSLNIDYTFKRVEGKMNEWEVAGFLDRFKKRITFGSLYCDTATREAFSQLFTELFDTIRLVTGEILKLAPFFPDAACRVIILDGEVPQAQGLADFLAVYNNPEISGIHTRDPVILLASCLKSCNPHFERFIATSTNSLHIYQGQP